MSGMGSGARLGWEGAGGRAIMDTVRDPPEARMSRLVSFELEVPGDLGRFRLPPGVDARLQHLLARQDRGLPLDPAERNEAEGLAELADLLTLLRLRVDRMGSTVDPE